LTLGLEGIERITNLRAGMRTLVVASGDKPGRFQIESRGVKVLS
jgi:hypothetical protein